MSKKAPAPTRQFDSIDDLVAAGYAPRAPLPEPEAPAKPAKKPGLMDQVGDLAGAAWQGVKSVGRTLGADVGLVTGDNRSVERLAASQQADSQANMPAAQRALQDEIQRRKDAAGLDAGALQAVGDVAGAAWDNKMGTAQLVAEQAPNAAVSLGAGWAGAQSGAALGALAGPAGAAVGGTLGFLGGMFLGNALLETGSKGMEKAQGGLTDEERGQALREGAIKAGVITGVDAATLGAGRFVSRALAKPAIQAGARAEAKVLADAGVNITDGAAIVKALGADPKLREAATNAGKQAAKAATTVKSRIANAGTVGAMETLGEGTGEYFGEKAATGKGDVYDAALEALAGFAQSAPETFHTLAQSSGNNLRTGGIQAQAPALAAAAAQPNSPLARAAAVGVQAAPAPAPEVDELGERAATIAEQAQQPDVLAAIRASGDPAALKTFQADLAVASSPSTPAHQREQALGRLEFTLGWASQQPPAPTVDAAADGATASDAAQSVQQPAAQQPATGVAPPAAKFEDILDTDDIYSRWSNLRDGSDRADMHQQIVDMARQLAPHATEGNRALLEDSLKGLKWFRLAPPEQKKAAIDALIAAAPAAPSAAPETAPQPVAAAPTSDADAYREAWEDEPMALAAGNAAAAPAAGPLDIRAAMAARTNEDGVLDGKGVAADIVAHAQDALAAGRQVTLYADGRLIPIVRIDGGMMADAKGQRWGALGLLTDPDGKLGNRLEFGPAQQPAVQPQAEIAPPPAAPTAAPRAPAEQEAAAPMAAADTTPDVQPAAADEEADVRAAEDAIIDAMSAAQAARDADAEAVLWASIQQIEDEAERHAIQSENDFSDSASTEPAQQPAAQEAAAGDPGRAREAAADGQADEVNHAPAATPQQQAALSVVEPAPQRPVPTPDDKAVQARRARLQHLQQLAGNGFETVGRDGDRWVMRNARTGQSIDLASAADAQLARNAVKRNADEVAARPKAQIEGEPINRNWTRFHPESGTLGIPREQMPQIAMEHRGALVRFLNARGVAHEAVEVPADSLKPTQAEFSPAKVEKAGDTGGDRSILISSDGYVLDGHHQWAAARAKGDPVKAIRLDAPIQDLLRLGHMFPSSFTANGAKTVEAAADHNNGGDTTPATQENDAAATQSASTEQGASEAPDAGTLPTRGVPVASPANDSAPGRAGNRDRQPLDAGVAAAGERTAGGERVPGGAEGSARGGSERAGAGVEPAAPGAARDQRPVRSDDGAAGAQPSGVSEDHTIDEDDGVGSGGLQAKYRDNIRAIEIARQLDAEGRPSTPEERKELAKYVGWGGLKGVFDPQNKAWAKQHAVLRSLLTEAEWKAASKSQRNAHYTSVPVVKAIYGALERIGFTGGRVLEPSVGVGNFFGLMPARVRNASRLHGVELDAMTSLIVRHLYPGAKIAGNTGFQNYSIPDGYFDLVVGNPPFGSEPLVDGEGTPYSGWSIHNYFFGKSIDKVRPGGLVAMVVSHNLMDRLNPEMRRWMGERAELVDAVRLPNTAFQDNANTSVVTDVLVFRRLGTGEKAAGNTEWLNTVARDVTNPKTGETFKVEVNEFFDRHPEKVLGAPSAAGAMYRAGEYTVEPAGDWQKSLKEWAASVPADLYRPVERKSDELDSADSAIPDGVKVGGFFVGADGAVRQRITDTLGTRRSQAWEAPNATAEARMRGMIGLRVALREQMRLERDPQATEAAVEAHRRQMSAAYDDFVAKFGHLNADTNRRIFADDTEAALLQALEFDYDPGVSRAIAAREGVEVRAPKADKADILSRRVLFPPTENLIVASARDALLASLNERGRLDMDYMRSVYDSDADAITAELGDMVYSDPASGELVMHDEYLSGDVKTKLAAAREAARADKAFARNVAALEAVIPADKMPSEIHAPLGAAWIAPEVYAEFMRHTTGAEMRLHYIAATAQWISERREGSGDAAKLFSEYGTPKMGAADILAALLNSRAVEVKKRVVEADGKEKYVTDEEQTEAARDKAEKLRAEWDSWLWSDPERASRLAGIYNERFNRRVERGYDGSHLSFPGMSPAIKLLAHQKNAVWRGLQDRNLLLDHTVGAGKTFEMAAIAMEMRRLGIARKPLFAVPNHLTLQWRGEFARLYPGANVLAATPKDFDKDNRKKLFSKIATGNWDAVVVGHSSLKKIGVAPEVEQRIIGEQLDDIAEAIEELKRARGDRNVIRDMEGIKARLEARLEKQKERAGKKDDVVNFDELGIDALFVDELHEFKNLFFNTQMQRVSGLGNPSGSGKAFDLFVKIRWLQDTLGADAPLVTGTGTPVSNSLSEMFTMQRLHRYGELKHDGLHLFDAWAKQYGDVESVYEVAPSGVGYRISQRFSKFKNLPSLMGLYRSFADVVTLDHLKAQEEAAGKRFPVPKITGGRPQNIVVKRSQLQSDFFGVPRLRRTPEGAIAFELEDIQGLHVAEMPAAAGKDAEWAILRGENVVRGGYASEQEARESLASLATTPSTELDPESLLGQFANLRNLTKQSKGKINALSLTGLANKAGLDYRLIDPSAPDHPGSKINMAVDRAVALWKQWARDKGAQLIFCDLSVPLSARAKMASKDKRVFVRDADGALTHKKGTLHALEGHEGLPFYLVKEKDGISVYEPVSGQRLANGYTDRKQALEKVEGFVKSEANRDRWLEMRERGRAITDEEISEYRDANELETEADGSNEISRDDLEAAAGSSQFSVYDDIRAKLIARGVPAAQIEFIHDHDSPSAKDKLFKRVKSGEVRFLLGSTPKMGAGTNVQDRLVGLHHIDAPWRPSDLEQREGRIIRRGNRLYERNPDGFEVFIGRYATEQTYDTRRWQLLEHKASGIEQLRNYNGQSEIDDVASEAANAADMKAAASGNPLILKETELRTELRRLQGLEKAHRDNAMTFGSSSRWAREQAETYLPKQLREVRSLIELRDTSPFNPEKPAITIDGKRASGREAVIKALSFTVADASTDTSEAPRNITFRGLPFAMRRHGASLEVNNPMGGLLVVYPLSENISSSGLLTRLGNYAERLDAHAASLESDIGKEFARADTLAEQSRKPFEDAAMLKRTKAEHAKVQRALMKSSQAESVLPQERAEFNAALAQRRAQLEQTGYGDALRSMEAQRDDTISASANRSTARTLRINTGRDEVELQLLDDADLARARQSTQREDDGRVTVSDTQAALLRKVAELFGKQVEFFRDEDGSLNGADGFVRHDNPGTVYLNHSSGISPLAVLGHEMLHLLKADNPQGYKAVAEVVEQRLGPDAAAKFRDYYHGDESGNADPLSEKDLEELTADLSGNLFQDPKFWGEVFGRIEAEHGAQAKGIIARLIASVRKLIGEVVAAFKGQRGFETDEFIADLEGVRAALRQALADYARAKGGFGVQAEVLRAETAAAKEPSLLEKAREVAQQQEAEDDVSFSRGRQNGGMPPPADNATRLWHYSSKPFDGKIAANGRFGGIFALVSPEDARHYGSRGYAYDVTGEIFTNRDFADALDDRRDEAAAAIEKALRKQLSDDDLGDVLWLIKDEYGAMGGEPPSGDMEHLMDVMRAVDDSDLYAEAQQLRGTVAKALGASAIHMNDEFGSDSVLLLPGDGVEFVGSFDADKGPDDDGPGGGISESKGRDSSPERGQPAHSGDVFWHGTAGDHAEFSDKHAGSVSSGDGRGFWFTREITYASEYAQNAAAQRGLPPRILEARVTFDNPLVVRALDPKGRRVLSVDGVEQPWQDNSDVIDYALKHGHDAIDWIDGSFTDEPSITVFSPDQIEVVETPREAAQRNLDVLARYDGDTLLKVPQDLADLGVVKPAVRWSDEFGGYEYLIDGEASDEVFDERDDAFAEGVQQQIDALKAKFQADMDRGPYDDDPGGGIKQSTARDTLAAAGKKVADLPAMLTSADGQRAIRDAVGDLFRNSGTFGLWHKTVGTQYQKAQKSPLFRRVFEAAQDFLHDTSFFANTAADQAPDLLPRLENFKDVAKRLKLSQADSEAIAKAVFTGTLEKQVFGPDDLAQRFKLDERQAGLYYQFRRAVNLSLDQLASAEVLRLVGEDGPAELRSLLADGEYGAFRDAVRKHVVDEHTAARAALKDAKDHHQQAVTALNRQWAAEDKTTPPARALGGAEGLKERRGKEMAALQAEQAKELRPLEAKADKWKLLEVKVSDKYDRLAQLKVEGYAPLMRFGRYAVHVTGQDGESLYFGLYESQFEANRAARDLKDEFKDEPGAAVSQSVMSLEAYKLMKGVSPETLALFGEAAGMSKDEAFQQYLKLATANHSALRRLIHRKGIAGFSQEPTRVLAAFLTGNARRSAGLMHFGEMDKAVRAAQEAKLGDVADEAFKLRDYVQNPTEEAAGLKNLMFINYIGGSVASALVNLTQPLTMTLPYLSQWGGPAKSLARLTAAMKDAAGAIADPTLKAALDKAESEGIVAPQEMHELQSEAQRALTNHPLARKGLFLWGSLFQLAESFNRRATFVAAYRTALDERMEDPFAFATQAVTETQGLYDKSNRPNWARGAIGGTLFVFKQFSISYMEFMSRLPNREKALALGVLILFAGLQGLPGGDDADDVIDTLGQRLGYNTNAKLWKQQVLEKALGRPLAGLLLRGLTGLPGAPIDVSGRMSLGNLIPATGLFRKDHIDHGADVAELLGALGGLKRQFEAVANGDLIGVLPVGLQNIAKGWDMATTGAYRDARGRKVVDTDGWDAAAKTIGFQPGDVAQEQRRAGAVQQTVNMAKVKRDEFAQQWAEGLFQGDAEQVARARERLAAWNDNNPDSPIRLNPADVRKRVDAMRSDRAARVEKAAPKAMRNAVRAALGDGDDIAE